MPATVSDDDLRAALPGSPAAPAEASLSPEWSDRDAFRQARRRARWSQWLRALALVAGFATPFTVSLVGEMPVGEVILLGVAAVAGFGIVSRRRWPGQLMAGRLFRLFLFAQAVAFLGYVLSDLARGSSSHDAVRGWARMGFLTVDLVAVAYLFENSPRNFVGLGVLGGIA